jgi:hypothetical protein
MAFPSLPSQSGPAGKPRPAPRHQPNISSSWALSGTPVLEEMPWMMFWIFLNDSSI